jgi:hypothetical protein
MLRALVVLAWVAFPLVVLLVSFGCGLLVERGGGWRMPGPIVAGTGLAFVIVLAELLTESTALAPTTTWVVLGIAVLGYASSVPRLRTLRFDGWTLALGLCLFAVFAAPIVLSGHPTFGGYAVDGDPAFHFLLALELLAHGHRSLNDLPNDTFPSVQIMRGYLASDYPVGADLAVGALRPLVGVDLAWIYSPFIATFLTFGGLALEELLRGLVESRPLRTLCAFIAAQAGLAYSLYLISSIKELAIIWLTVLLVVLVALVLGRRPSARALVPVAVVTAAALYVLAVPAVPWIGLPLLALTIGSLWRVRRALRRPSPRTIAAVTGVIALTAAISLPVLLTAVTSFNTTSSVLTSGSVTGELLGPLSKYEIFGIWPVGDFRRPLLLHATPIHIVIWIAIASTLVGGLWTLQRRAWGPALLLLGNAFVGVLLLRQATPYAASKVEAILSTTAVLAAMLGAVALSRAWRPLGWVLAAVLTLAVLWTNDKSLRAAPLAPQPRFAELSRIDARFAGPGPSFYNLWDAEYSTYFARRLGAYEPGIYEFPPTRPGAIFPAGLAVQIPWDPNDLEPAYVQSMRLLVLGRSPVLSRPPADFRLVFRGRYYDVYEHEHTPRVLAHDPVTTGPLGPKFTLSCARIRRVAARARSEHGRLAFAPKPALASVQASHSTHPLSWLPYPPLRKDKAGTAVPGGLALSTIGGTLTSKIRVPRTGRYTVWLEGSLTQQITISVAGRRVGSVSNQVGPGGLWSVVGSVELPAGVQRVIMHRAGASRLQPVGIGDVLGSLVLTRNASPPPVRTVPPRRWRALCQTPLQWLEIIR